MSNVLALSKKYGIPSAVIENILREGCPIEPAPTVPSAPLSWDDHNARVAAGIGAVAVSVNGGVHNLITEREYGVKPKTFATFGQLMDFLTAPRTLYSVSYNSHGDHYTVFYLS